MSIFCPKIQFWQFFLWNESCQQLKSPKPQHFHELHEFFIQIFLGQFFSWNESCQQLKKSKITTFSRVFHPKTINNFLGKSKLNFWKKWRFRTVCPTNLISRLHFRHEVVWGLRISCEMTRILIDLGSINRRNGIWVSWRHSVGMLSLKQYYHF